MLNNKHLKVIYYEQNSSVIFPNTDIKGGIAITYHDSFNEFGEIGTFTSYGELNTILHKVLDNDFESFNSLLFGKSSYKFTSELYKKYPTLRGRVSANEEKSIGSNIFEKLPEIFSNKKQHDNQIGLLGRENNQRIVKWLDRDLIEPHPNLEKYKVIIPASNGSGAIGEVISTPLIGDPLIGDPLIGHTQTFISFGAFDDKFIAERVLKYIKTKFMRTLLGTLKITQHNQSKDVWKNVPMQDFSDSSDIDWSQSIINIDQQLYKKYGLSDEEIAFIEEKVKEME